MIKATFNRKGSMSIESIGMKPAFPSASDGNTKAYLNLQAGMSYREWLIGCALQGFLANENSTQLKPDALAAMSVQAADAILARISSD